MSEETAAVVTESKRPRILTKEINGSKVILTVGGIEDGRLEFDVNDYPPGIQEQLKPFGAGHKLGDSAAGRKGQDAKDAILKTHEALMKGDWSFRAPAAPKMDVKDLQSKVEGLGEEEKEIARKLFERLGINITI